MFHTCAAGGYLVDSEGWLPDEPFDFHWMPFGAFIGCGRLRCEACRAWVRSVAGRSGAPGASASAIYDAIGSGATDGGPIARDPVATGRLYACRCYEVTIHGVHGARQPFDPITEEATPWRCDGHPALTIPSTVAGVSISRDTDLVALARAIFSGASPMVFHPSMQAIEGLFIQRLYNLFVAPTDEKIALAVAALVADPSPRVRQCALRFYDLNFTAPGADAVPEADRAHAELYAHAPTSTDPLALRPALQQTLARLARADATAGRGSSSPSLLRLQEAALVAPGIGRHLHVLADLCRPFALAHGDALLRACPGDWRTVLYALRDSDKERLTEIARQAIALGPASRAEVVAWSASHLPDDISARI